MNLSGKKFALCLSGGGFRASIFHIGVLSFLAEINMLKEIEVISCVSGGSIIGAYYYLYLKDLFEKKPDKEIMQSDYIELVKKMSSAFLTGVQKNIRIREYSNALKNLYMIKENYSNSDRMAELYDKMFFNQFSKDGILKMRDLVISPEGKNDFNAGEINTGRINKIPFLILNSSNLSTGRNWQFTPIDLGEREPDSEAEKYDKNCILRAFKYEDLMEKKFRKYRDLPLSIAVASSAGVPGIFSPLSLTKLYRDSVPLLVDGGVYDNQGLSAVLSENCSDIIVSDASNQLEFKKSMGSDLFNVLSRTNSIQMNRIRNAGLGTLNLCENSGKINDSFIIHLLEDLKPKVLLPRKNIISGNPESKITSFGVDKKIRDYLSKMRTDLDCFTEIESYSLMYEAYRISEYIFSEKKLLSEFGISREKTKWEFLDVKDLADGKKQNKKYEKYLKTGSKVFMKPVIISPILLLPISFILLLCLIPVSLCFYLVLQSGYSEYLIKMIYISVIIFFIPWSANTVFKKRIKLLNWLKLPLSLMLSPCFSIFCSLYILLINPIYKKIGKLKKFLKN